MALLWADIHRAYPTGAPPATGHYDGISGTVTNTAGAGPNGGPCLVTAGGAGSENLQRVISPTIAAGSVFTIGGRYRIEGYPGANTYILEAREGSGTHLSVRIDANGKLVLKRGYALEGADIATGATTVPLGEFFTVELKATIADVGGTAELRLTIGTTTTTEVSYTGDTMIGGTGVVDRASWGNYFGSALAFRMASLYMTSGADGYLGTFDGVLLLPTADGTFGQGAPSAAGAAHYTMVDEAPAYVNDSIALASAGQRETFVFEDVSGASVLAVVPKCTIDAAAGVQFRSLAYRNATAGTGDTVTAVSGSREYLLPTTTDPTTGAAWTPTGVSAAEWGLETVAGGATVYRMALEVLSAATLTVGTGGGGGTPAGVRAIAPVWIGL